MSIEEYNDYVMLEVKVLSDEFDELAYACVAPLEETDWGYHQVLSKSFTLVYPSKDADTLRQIAYQCQNDSFFTYVVNFDTFVQTEIFHSPFITSACFVYKELLFPKDNEISNVNPVDLGGTIYWADRNIGASDIYEAGSLVASREIRNVIVEGWRLPTVEEVKQLLFLQHHHYFSYNDDMYTKISANNNELLLPYSGHRANMMIMRKNQCTMIACTNSGKLNFMIIPKGFPIDLQSAGDGYSVRLVKNK